MAALLSGEIDALSTGFSEAVALEKAGKVRIIGVTSDKRVPAAPNAPTLKEQGYDEHLLTGADFLLLLIFQVTNDVHT